MQLQDCSYKKKEFTQRPQLKEYLNISLHALYIIILSVFFYRHVIRKESLELHGEY